jgi:hypothetical protein
MVAALSLAAGFLPVPAPILKRAHASDEIFSVIP